MRRAPGLLAISVGLLVLAAQPVAAIVYGQETGAARYGNVGAIVVDPPGAQDDPFPVCSGARISEGTFLTAAHCIEALAEFGGFLEGDVYVTFHHDASVVSAYRDVLGAHVHPAFDQRRSNPHDIGLLMFDDTAGQPSADVAAPGEFTPRQLRSARYTAVGYGVTRETKRGAFQSIDDNVLRRYAEQRAQSLGKAWLHLAMNDRAEQNGGTCNGDSGGPHFFGATQTIASITITGDVFCKALDKTYRVDTTWVADFLADY